MLRIEERQHERYEFFRSTTLRILKQLVILTSEFITSTLFAIIPSNRQQRNSNKMTGKSPTLSISEKLDLFWVIGTARKSPQPLANQAEQFVQLSG